MRKIELVDGIRSSVLGFGCAPIQGSVDASTAARALEVALDCGITHYDLARSYGYGEAEQFVGKVMKNRRDQVVLASKFGIVANWKSGLLRPVKPVVRALRGKSRKEAPAKMVPAASAPIAVADRFHDRLPITSENMRRSLERTLRALGTDYLDFYFVHEPPERVADIDDLSAAAEALKTEGKIRAWGLAYNRTQEPLHRSYLERFDVLQFDCSPGAPGYDEVVAARGALSNVLFSPLRGGSADMKPADKLGKLFVDFPRSVVLCSMFSEHHLRENARLAS